MNEAFVFSIEEFSTYDGPGIRTTVFLKGCPLHCEWCHNPEGQSFENEIIKSQYGCTSCGECLKYADISNGKASYTQESIAHCPNRLLRFAAESYTPEKLVEKLSSNLKILNNSSGGVTFSGGEPLSHPDYLLDCLKLLHGKTNRALQTSGFCKSPIFEQVLQNIDYVLFDIKIVDDELHKRYTGVSNKQIFENFEMLTQSNVPFVVRTPLIPTVTDTPENLTDIARLLSIYSIKEIDLLPYNKVAGGKYAAVGRDYNPSFDESIPSNPRLEILKKFNIKANLV